MLALLSPLWAKVLSLLGKLAVFATPLGFIVPALTGIAQFIGGLFTAVAEIIVSLAKSAEGRVVLASAAAGLGFLYLRFHFIEEGKAMAQTAAYEQGLAKGKTLGACQRAKK
jgi:phage-related minor tail protein